MFTVPEQYRITKEFADKYPHLGRVHHFASDKSIGNQGAFFLPRQGKHGYYFFAIAASAMGFEHVSVSIPTEKRCPTWEEMCYVKDLFWSNDSCVIQYHPPRSNYVNNHDHCLHLWRPIGVEIPIPQTILV